MFTGNSKSSPGNSKPNHLFEVTEIGDQENPGLYFGESPGAVGAKNPIKLFVYARADR
jgi:hypothetical protein